MKNSTFISVGSNQGYRLRNINRALNQLKLSKEIAIKTGSFLYETLPVGGPRQKNFLNGLIQITTDLKPNQLLKKLQEIERDLGRKRNVHWGPRTLDLDIIAQGSTRMNRPHLKIPHPEYHKRVFVLRPLCDIAPHFIHPILKRKNRTLLNQLTGSGQRATIVAQWKNGQFYPYKIRKKHASQ